MRMQIRTGGRAVRARNTAECFHRGRTTSGGRGKREEEGKGREKSRREEDIPRLPSISKRGVSTDIKETCEKRMRGTKKATRKPERQGEKLEIIRLPCRSCAGSSTSACSFSLGIGSTGKYAL